MVIVTHEMKFAHEVAHRVVFLDQGRIVEEGPTERVYSNPAHPYTESLLSAVPVPDPVVQRQRRRVILSGDIPDPLHPPSGCTFRTRCQHAMDICAQVEPEHTELPDGGWVACHLHTTQPGTRTDPTTQERVEPPVTAV